MSNYCFNVQQHATCHMYYYANKCGALPGVKPNMSRLHSNCEASHILRVKGDIFIQAVGANRNVCRLTAAAPLNSRS